VAAALMAACAIAFAACRTVVPAPTATATSNDLPLPSYRLHNVGPQRVNASRAMAVADVNQDGSLDLLIGGRAPHNQSFRIEWGDGKGRWSLEDGPLTGMQPRAFSVGDVNADGINEIVIGGQGETKGLQVWQLDTEKHIWRLHSQPTQEGIFNAVRFADVNEDGWPDLIAMRMDSEPDGGIYIFLNDGKGGWMSGVNPMVEGRFTGLVVTDMNGDGHADVVASRRAGMGSSRLERRVWREVGGVQIWYGDGTGRWEPEYLQADGDADSVTVADINDDGRKDIIAGMYLVGIRAWLGQGNRSWDRRVVTERGTWASVSVGVRSRDIVAASTDGHGIGIWEWKHRKELWSEGFAAIEGLVPNFGFYSRVALGRIIRTNRNRLDIAALRADGAVEVWSLERAAAQPLKDVVGYETGKPLRLLFDTGQAVVTDEAGRRLADWLKTLPDHGRYMSFRIEGHADIRPIHSREFPDNTALSWARSMAAMSSLGMRGIDRNHVRIIPLGDSNPLPPGMTAAALQQNRRVLIRAYQLKGVRLPAVATTKRHIRDLFHVKENAVFKTLNGIQEYKIGAGDDLSITLWQGGKSTIYKVKVKIDGTVSFPFFPALSVGGKTPSELEEFIVKSLSRFVRHPRVDVFVLKAASKTASIFGEIQNLTRQPTGPGTYFLAGRETLAEFLSRVGGPTRQADLTKVQIIRHGGKVVLNLDRAIKENDWRENAIIDEGDTIFVPSLSQSKHRVYVLGEVKKPGIVDYIGNISFLDALSKAGGLGKSAYTQDIRIIRQNRDRPLILPVAFNRFMEQGDLTQNPQLMNRDVIIVPAEPIANWNRLLAKLTPTLNTVISGSSAVNEVVIVRDILRGAGGGGGGVVITAP